MGPKQGHGDPRSHCRYTQGRNISGSFCVNIDPSLTGEEAMTYSESVLLHLELLQNCCSFVKKKDG